jgi:hypothetical protein
LIIDGAPIGLAEYLLVDSNEKWIKFSTDPLGDNGVQMDFP